MWMQCRALGQNLKVFLWVTKHSPMCIKAVFPEHHSSTSARPPARPTRPRPSRGCPGLKPLLLVVCCYRKKYISIYILRTSPTNPHSHQWGRGSGAGRGGLGAGRRAAGQYNTPVVSSWPRRLPALARVAAAGV